MEALRACLATAKALDLETRPVWLMIIGPGSVGKSSFYLQSCTSYLPHVLTDELSIPGILSGSNKGWGKGVLQRLGKRGLWIVNDFTVMLNASEDKRNALLGAWRKIYDGHYDRNVDGDFVKWDGHTHVIMGCTPAIERFYRVHSDLGERFLQVRIEKCQHCDDLVRKMANQNGHWQQFQAEVVTAAKELLDNASEEVSLTFRTECDIAAWADFISMGRAGTTRNYKDEIVGVSAEEGTARAGQQLLGLAKADAMLMQQNEVSELQMPLIRRVAFDCLPGHRRAILSILPAEDTLSESDLQEISGITHPYTFERALQELQAIGAIEREQGQLRPGKVRAADKFKRYLY